MTPRLSLLDNETLVVSPTQLEVVRTCPRMWLYRYLHKRLEIIPDAARQGGHAYDSALNLRYKRCGSDPVDPATEEEQMALIDAAYKDVELPLDEFRTPTRYKEVIRDYNAHYGAEPFRVLGVQVPFMVELGQVQAPEGFWRMIGASNNEVGQKLIAGTPVRVLLRGILDIYAQLSEHTVIIDTKTSKSDIGGSYDNSAQMKLYMWALMELARVNPDAGLPPVVHACLINGITIRPPYKQEGRTAKANDRPRNQFMRTMPQFYSTERLEECRRDSLLWVEQALGWYARGHFPQNERHCTFHQDAAFINYGYYGKPCPYLQVCSVPEAQRSMVLGSDAFQDDVGGPLGAPQAAPEALSAKPLDTMPCLP